MTVRQWLWLANLSAGLWCVWGASPAQGQGFEAAPFRPASSSRSGYVTVEDAAATLPRLVEVHGTLAYERGLLTLSQGSLSSPLVSHRLALQLGASVAPIERLRLHASMPFYLVQRGDDALLAPSNSELDRGGVGDLRLLAKVRLAGHAEGEPGFGLGASLALTLPTAHQTRLQGEGVRAAPTLHVDYVHRLFSAAVSVGYMVRPERVLVGLHIDDSLELGLAGRVPLGASGLVAIAEFSASLGVQGPSVGQARTRPMMVHAALRGLHGPVVWTVGAGAGLTSGYAAPELRLFGQLAYSPQVDEPRDADGDGILDASDECPLDSEDADGFDDLDGCPDPDNDQDGIADAQDGCTLESEDADGFDDLDGCPDPDNDQDGIADAQDGCTLESEDADGFDDLDGCPDPDNDQDGVPDTHDACPLTAGDPDWESPGCPAPVPVPVPTIQIDEVVRFRTRSAELDGPARMALDQIVATLSEHPSLRMRVVGHADQRGSDQLNSQLSQARANAVRDYLVTHGVDPVRLEAVGHGTTELLDASATDTAYQRNRRVQFVILEGSE